MPRVAPARCGGLDELMRIVLGEVSRWRGERDFARARALSQHGLQPLRPLEPPVPKQLRIERRKDHWRHLHALPQHSQLRRALGHEMRGVTLDGAHGGGAVVGLLRLVAGDAVKLQPGELPRTIGEKRQQCIERRIPPSIAVKLPVSRVAGIAVSSTPHLPRRVPVAPKRSDSGRHKDRRPHSISRLRRRASEAVGIQRSPAHTMLGEQGVEPRRVGTLGHPKPRRLAPKHLPMRSDAKTHLRIRLLHEREEPMRGRTSDKL